MNPQVTTSAVIIKQDDLKLLGSYSPDMKTILPKLLRTQIKVKTSPTSDYQNYDSSRFTILTSHDNKLSFKLTITLDPDQFNQLTEGEKDLFINPQQFILSH